MKQFIKKPFVLYFGEDRAIVLSSEYNATFNWVCINIFHDGEYKYANVNPELGFDFLVNKDNFQHNYKAEIIRVCTGYSGKKLLNELISAHTESI